jgi:hypothetical protein
MKHYSKISRTVPGPNEARWGPKDGFVFSDNIEDWMNSKKLKTNARLRGQYHKNRGGRKEDA